jgi:hypothetical protein
LVEGLFELGSLVMVAGPPGNYKSFLAIDWALSIATGMPWHGRVVAPARVLYCLGEGKSSLLKRVGAWAHYHQLDAPARTLLQENFRVTFEVPQMAANPSVSNLLAGLEAESFAPSVVILDTFARSAVGLDENNAKETGLWVEGADRLRQLGMTVVFLHHTNKNTEFGYKYRGSSAIEGALDTAFIMFKEKDNPSRSVLKCTKQKDHDEPQDMSLQKVKVLSDEDDSMVLVPAMKVDERFTEPGRRAEALIDELLDDPSFESNRKRGIKLSALLNISESAAISRIDRRDKDRKGVALQNFATHDAIPEVVEYKAVNPGFAILHSVRI